MKLRFSNYKLAYLIFHIVGFFWKKVLKRGKKGILFSQMDGLDYSRDDEWGDKQLIDKYYLLWFK